MIPDNFLGIPSPHCDYENASVVIVPVPFEQTSSWLQGSVNGPGAIIKASRNIELYDIEQNREPYLCGIFTGSSIIADDAPGMIEQVYSAVSRIIDDGKIAVTLGGEHTVSVGAAKAYSEKFPGIGILHFDAHSDMREEYDDTPYSHASALARIKDFNPCIVSVGVRSMDISELPNIKRENYFFGHEIHLNDLWMEKCLEKLPQEVYITLDLDVLDPSIMPSTGTPEPGGMGWYQILRFLSLVSKNRQIKGFDIVELCPADNKAPDFLAAKLIYKMIGMIL
ncbi:MAG: agmatinase [Firmicutes bacterium]|nr:agmatinase [Bacillota bacterium]